MFCEKCGKPVEEGQRICPECEAFSERYIQDPIDEEISTVEQYQEESFTLNTEGYVPPKKSKKGVVIGAVAAVAVIAVAAIVLCWDSILGLFGVMKFDTPQEHFAYVEKQSIGSFAHSVVDSYSLGMDSYGGTAKGNAELDVHVLIGDELIDLAETSLAASAMEIELDFLKDICLELDGGFADSMYQYDFGIGLGDTRVLTVSCLSDISEYVYWLTIPEITDKYLEIDSVELGLTTPETIQEEMAAYNELIELMPSGENLDALIDKYLDIVLSHITDVEVTTQTIEIDGLSQELTVLKAKVDEQALLNTFIDILETAKTDEIIKSFVVNIGEYSNQQSKVIAEEYGEEYEPVDAYAEFIESVDSGLEELRGYLADADPANYIVITDYVDKKQKIVGREFYVASVDEAPIEIRCLTVTQKDQFALRFNADTFAVEGSGTNADGVANGTYIISVDGEEAAQLVLKDAAENKGTVQLKPSSELVDAFAEDTGLGSILSLVDMTLELEYASNGQDFSGSLKALAGDKLLVGLTLDAAAGDELAPVKPQNAVSVMDEEALLELISTLDVTKVTTNLEDAGVPQEYAQLVQYLLEAYINELSYYGY